MLLPSLTCLAFLSGSAHADEKGLVVRLEMPGEPVPTAAWVILQAEGGTPVRIEVKDNGQPPDVTAGDLSYAGSKWLEGDNFEISLEIDGKTVVGGPASWGADDQARDLVVSYTGGTVTIEAGVSGGGSEPPTDGAAVPGAAAGEATPGATPTTPPPSGGLAGPGFANNPSDSSSSSLYLAFGLGLMVLVGLAWLWLRNRGSDAPGPISGLARVPEPGLLGGGSPSLSDGLQVWIVTEADAAALVRPLLATLARHHRVLVVAPSTVNVTGVPGGPVFRSTNLRPAHVAEAANSLEQNGHVVATLLFGTQGDANSVKEYADLLPAGTGGVCVLFADPGVPALPRVTARRDGPVWVIQTAEGTRRLVETMTGFVAEPTR